MLIKQISIFVTNKPGRLAEISKILKDQQINILAMSLADTVDYGILRLIVSKPDAAEKVLKECGLTVKVTEVLGVVLEHNPGGLSRALEVISANNISINYVYAFVGSSGQEAMVIIKVEDNARAIDVLTKSGIKLLSSDFVDTL